MSQLRQDLTTKEWVIVAPGRARRPQGSETPRPRATAPHDETCPFCPGNEDRTPPEIIRTTVGPVGDGVPWDQRVVPNLYPALDDPGSTLREGDEDFRQMDGIGSHEVVIESPRHDERMDEMPVDRLTRVLRLWRDRYLDLGSRPWAKAVILFRNFGVGAGTSLHHPHTQIVALPVLPPDLLHRYAVATRYHDDTGECVYCHLRDAELRARARVVTRDDGFVAWAPFAGRVPFEVWVAPRTHETSFGSLEDDRASQLAVTLQNVLGSLRRVANDPDYNLVLRSAPVDEEAKPFFLWHLRIVPRTSTEAGLELGSGMAINTRPPEETAGLLREALVSAS